MEFPEPFMLIRPTGDGVSPVVFNSPHSGATYPDSFVAATRLGRTALRRSEDSFVDELFSGCMAAGIPLLHAVFPRAYVDVNREPYELDPTMFDGRLPPFSNTRSMRVAGGLGTIARIVADNEEIYSTRLPVRTALQRIDACYKPYHAKLKALIDLACDTHDYAILIDCHSMPSQSSGGDDRARPDFVLGDRYGTSCTNAIADTVQRALRAMGYTVTRNKPYAGGYITERYGRPRFGRHALQIEVNRALYMDEARFEKTAGFVPLRDNLTALAAMIVDLPADWLRPMQSAAE
ncbi:MAG: N-formylglutamate amidohydrolase [Pseudomonadota bacterium]